MVVLGFIGGTVVGLVASGFIMPFVAAVKLRSTEDAEAKVVGHIACVAEAVNETDGRVWVEGVLWPARSVYDSKVFFEENEQAVVAGIEDGVLLLRRK